MSLQLASIAIWALLLAAGSITERIFARQVRSDRADEGARAIDRVMMVASGLCLLEPFLGQFFSELRASATWVAVGTVIATAGILIRVSAMRALGGRYVLTPVAQPGEGTLVTVGLYRYVRHPGYLGLYLYFLGLGLMLAPLVGLIVEVPLVALGSVRILGEERILAREFGARYAKYKESSRWRVIPWLY